MAVVDLNALNFRTHNLFLRLEMFQHLAVQIYQIGSHTGCPLEAAEFSMQLLL